MSYIIGLGGVRAVGKSTIARKIGDVIRGDVISIGRIRDIVRYFDQKKNPVLYESVTDAPTTEQGITFLHAQVELIRPCLLDIIHACREREANLILEGTHIYPGAYTADLDVEILLVSSKERLDYRIHKDKKRRVSENVLERNFQIQESLKGEAMAKHTPIVDTTSIPSALIEVMGILAEQKDKLPKTWYE